MNYSNTKESNNETNIEDQNLERKKDKQNFEEVLKEFISPYHVSSNPYELESASADLTSLPSYHYKFKKSYLANLLVRPADTSSLSKVIEKCREREIPVTVRAAGTSCFSSATPSKGGIIIDTRRLNLIHYIDKDNMTVKVGSGISWLNLIEKLADYGLAPKCYPTSFKTSCVGGFIATPGTAGIGILKYGTMKDSIINLKLVLPDGKVMELSKDSNGMITLEDVCGTYGIYGAIAEVELSLTTLKTSLEIVGYGFKSIHEAVEFYQNLKNDSNKPFFISISERKFEKYSHVSFPDQDWLVWAVFYDDPEITSQCVSASERYASELNGVAVDKSYLKEKWRDVSDAEVAIGRSSRNLIFQEYWIADKRLESFIQKYLNKSNKYKFPTALYTISGPLGWSRVKIFGLSDIERTSEFFTVKAFLHDLSIQAFTQGDRVYTIGIVNTFYLFKYKPQLVSKMKTLKNFLDPKDLFNSYRIVNTRLKFWRVSLLFNTAKLLYKIF